MNVGNSVRKAIDDWGQGEAEASMLHACNAVDGTAKKVYPELGVKARFTLLLRDNYGILGPMAAPGVNLAESRFPVKVAMPKATGGLPDIADVVYGIHRCSHGHGDDLPDGFSLRPDAEGSPFVTTMLVQEGLSVSLSDRLIFGLLGVAVFSSVNIGQRVPDDYYLSLGDTKFPINEWWGRASDFIAIASKLQMPSVVFDFSGSPKQ